MVFQWKLDNRMGGSRLMDYLDLIDENNIVFRRFENE